MDDNGSVVRVGVVIPGAVADALDRIAADNPVRPSRSQIMRQAFEEFVARHGPPAGDDAQ